MYRLLRTIIFVGVLATLFVVATEKYKAYQQGQLAIPWLGIEPKPIVPEAVISGNTPISITGASPHQMLELTLEANNRRMKALLDTGAYDVAFTPKQAQRLDEPYHVTEPDPEFGYVTSYYAPISISVGDLTASNLIGASLSSFHGDRMLLGMEYLKHFDFHFQDGQFTLYPAGQLSLDWLDEAAVVSKLDSENSYFLAGKINDHPVRILFDTGAAKTGVRNDIANKIGLAPHATVTVSTVLGLLEDSYSKYDQANLQIDELAFTDMPIGIYEPQFSNYLATVGRPIDGLLGQDVMQHLEYAQINQTLYIRANKKTAEAGDASGAIRVTGLQSEGEFGMVFSEFSASMDQDDWLCFPGTLNGYPTQFRLDTIDAEVAISDALAYRANLKRDTHEQLTTLSVSGLTIRDMPAVLYRWTRPPKCFSLGYAFWQHLDFTFTKDDETLWFAKVGMGDRGDPLVPTHRPHTIIPLAKNPHPQSEYDRTVFLADGMLQEATPVKIFIQIGDFQTSVSPKIAKLLQDYKRRPRSRYLTDANQFEVDNVYLDVGDIYAPLNRVMTDDDLADNEMIIGMDFLQHFTFGKRGDDFIIIDP